MVKGCIQRCHSKTENLRASDAQFSWPIDYAVFPKLMDLVDRWASEDSGSEPESRSAADFFDEFGKLTRDYDLGPEVRGAAKYLSIPEIATAAQLLKPFEALRLPPRQQVLYTEPIKKLITSSEFGALRYVRQLGFTHLVYPGAQGTRFEHSLGVYDLACHVVVRMSGREAFRSVCDDPRDIVKFIVAALLHDVGHFPFAHQLEEFRETDFDQQDRDRVRTLLGGHVNRGRQAIRGLEGLLHKLFNFTKEDIEEIVWLALGDEEKKPNEDGSGKPRTKSLLFLRTLIDGPTDLDKMDYIERDAHHCGVPYGFFIDVARINETMRILDGTKNIGKSALGFDVRAVGSLEQFATARHQLYANVYWHRAVRSATVMFKHAFYLFQQLIGNREDLEDLFYKTASDDCLLYRMTQLTEKRLEEADQKPEDKTKASAVLALLGAVSGNKKRVLYKAVLEIDRVSHDSDKPFGQQHYPSQRWKAKEIFEQLKRSGFLAEEASSVGEHNVLVDCHTDPFPVFGKIPIIRGDSDDSKDLSEFAPTVEQLEKSFTRQACKIRVFVNPEALKPGYRSKAGRADVRKFIEAKTI
jgi:HD superfamily phosphohydrolase